VISNPWIARNIYRSFPNIENLVFPLSELEALRAGSQAVSPTLRPVGGAGSWARILYFIAHLNMNLILNFPITINQ
jgi:hypothetical protein